ncbi:uncharacterized protein DDB_G0287625-like [Homarus americanus]|uniref:Caspase activity and apoptosis inhibitor 1-like n=1 Tax=Homarus americanus TaxID=6706 RepID=A0A8J5T5N0_HOMAM|nr:uncharacterized protein DDB_G0287625-like [Homarus americanus]KAG7172831.1 Caspase activity and apoptosis inhibitor 1-like [Homarus americanus]
MKEFMVTQDTVTMPKVKNMKAKKNRIKKAKKKKLKKGIENQESESEGDNLDLCVKLYPLSHHVSDQDELVNQMFATIRGSKLEAMLPPVLRGIPVKELKKLCLHELRGMSKKRILCCINGQMMEGSSGSDEDEEEDKEEQDKAAREEVKSQENNTKGDKRKSISEHIPEGFLQKKIKVEPGLEDTSGQGHDTGKSVLELLELEMRARIIKTMLEKGDEGKKIAEDAIAAVMQSAKQITKDDNQMSREKETKAVEAESKVAVVPQQQKITGEAISNEERRGDRPNGSKDGRTSHRRHTGRSRDDGSRKSSRRKVRDRRERSNSVVSDYGEHKKKPKGGANYDRHIQKKKKITRKEFEERMKRAKKNRTYRQRKTSEDEEKAKENKQEHWKEPNIGEGEAMKENSADGGKDVQNKPAEEPSGEVSEKEEGELDSNEEEEGACTPSDISSASNYYSSSPSSRKRSYSSRSRSKSFSKSRSRSPGRRKRRSSYTRSRTRSRSLEWKNKNEGKQNYERINKEPVRNDNISKKVISKASLVNPKENKEEEENWGQKCDIEFVDSEEDFDDNPDITKEPASQTRMPANTGHIIERASISFSLQKKSAPNITPSIDLDDLPLKQNRKNNVSNNFTSDSCISLTETCKSPNKAMEEIVISSDSESEKQKNVSLVTSRRKKKVTPNSKQAILEQSNLLLSKEEATKSVAEVVKKPAERKQETGEPYPECLTTERQIQSMDNNDPLTELNNDSAVEQREIKKQKVEQRPDEIETDIKNKCKDDSTSHHTAVQQLGMHSVDEVHVKTRLEDKSALNLLEKNNGNDTETPENVASQLSGPNNVDSSKKNISSNDHNVISNNDQKMRKCDNILANQVHMVSIQSCLSDPPIELSHSISKLISKGNHDSVNKKSISENKNLIGTQDMASGTFERTKELSNESCKENAVVEENKDSQDAHKKPKINKGDLWESRDQKDHEESKTSEDDHEESSKQEVQPETKESSMRTLVMERDLTKADSHAKIHEEKMVEQSLETDCPAEKCIERTEVVKEMDNGNRDTPEECLQKENNNFSIIEEEVGEKEKTSTNTKVKEVDSKIGEQTEQEFYRGAEQLTVNIDEKDDDPSVEEFTGDYSPVEPIRIDTGLIRKSVVRQQRVNLVMPDKSWTKRERKKKEKSRDTLVMEGIGFLKNTLSESSQRENEGVTPKTNKSDEKIELEETLSSSVASASETDNSILADDNTPTNSTIHSPKIAREQETTAPSPEAVSYEDYEPKSYEKSQKRIVQETEIIGVIETSKDSSSDNFDDSDLGGSSWSMRWLQSEKVQKVVTSSKMLSRVRKQIQKKDKATKVVTAEKTEEPQKKTTEPLVPVIGSIEEYERLFGMNVKKDQAKASDSSGTSPPGMTGPGEQPDQPSFAQESTQGPSTSAPSFGSDDEGEDSEEEALWTKILGK